MFTASLRHTLFGICLVALSGLQPVVAEAPRTLEWEDLLPPGLDIEALITELRSKYGIDDISDDDPRVYELQAEVEAVLNQAPVNETLNGLRVRLPGFVVPLETDGRKTREFLLVPYYGACIHVPPPPANQTVLVSMVGDAEASIRKLFDTVWVSGTIRSERLSTELAEVGYRIEATRVEPYE